MTPISVAQLVAEGRLEKVAADITAAWNRIDETKCDRCEGAEPSPVIELRHFATGYRSR